jgi:anti-sigma factor RsiW
VTDRDRRHLEGGLIAYLKDELGPSEREQARRHLATCPPCAAALVSHRELLRDLAASIPEPPPIHAGAYRAGLRDRLAARARYGQGRRWWRSPLPLGLSAGLAVALLLLTLHGPFRASEPRDLTAFEETVMGRRLAIMKAAPLVEHLDLLEDLEIIRELDRVAPTAES